MPTYAHGFRAIDAETLDDYPDPMPEADLAKFLGISVAHARRHRTPNPPNPDEGWPRFVRESVDGFHLAVFYKHSAVRKWLRGLEEVEV